MILTMYFAREVIQKSLNQILAKLGAMFKRLDPS